MKLSLDQNCLGHYDLVSYLSGAVYSRDKQRIEYHLSTCHLCFEIFIDTFNQYLEHYRDENEFRLGQDDFSNFAFENTSNEVWQL